MSDYPGPPQIVRSSGIPARSHDDDYWRRVARHTAAAGFELFVARRGCEVIELSATETNATAVALYQSRGFEPTSASELLRAAATLRILPLRWSSESEAPE